jgi:hypothetical protein
MGTSAGCRRSVVEFSAGNGAPLRIKLRTRMLLKLRCNLLCPKMDDLLFSLPPHHAPLPMTTDSIERNHRSPVTSMGPHSSLNYRPPARRRLHQRRISACHRAGFSPVLGQEMPQIVSVMPLVVAGVGVSIVPLSTSEFWSVGSPIFLSKGMRRAQKSAWRIGAMTALPAVLNS